MKNWRMGDKTDILIVREVPDVGLTGIPCEYNTVIPEEYIGMKNMDVKLPFVKKVLIFLMGEHPRDYLNQKYKEACKNYINLLDFHNPIIGDTQQKVSFEKYGSVIEMCQSREGICHYATKAENYDFKTMWNHASLGWIGIWYALLQNNKEIDLYGMNWGKEGFEPELCMIRSCGGLKDFFRVHQTPNRDYLPTDRKPRYYM